MAKAKGGNGVELANAWITIVPDTSKLAPSIKDAMRGVEPLAEKAGRSLGDRLTGALSKTLKVGAATAGASVAGIFGTSFAKGFSRMNATENAQAKLKALGNDAQDVAGIMDNALASVKGTAFGIGEAAGTASTLVAAGVKPGKELQGVLDAVADTASIAGTNMEDMGFIFGKAAAKGKLDGEIVAQLLERQIPVYDILSKKTGEASADIADMVSKGKIDFETFNSAMAEYVGGGARVMADTFDGSLRNMGASMGRFGEALEKPLYNAAPGFFKAVTGLFDDLTAAIKPAMAVVGDLLTPAFVQLGTVIETKLSPFMATLATQFGDLAVKLTTKAVDPALWERVGDVFAGMRGTVSELWPSIESLAGSFLSISKNISVATWEALTGVLNALAPLITSVLVPLVEKTAEFAEQNPGAVQAIVMAFLGFKAVSGPVAAATGAIQSLSGAISILKGGGGVVKALSSLGGIGAKLGGFAGTVSKVAGFVVKGLAFVNPWVAGIAAVTGALTLFFTKTETGQKILSGFVDFVTGAWSTLSGTVSQITSILFKGDFKGGNNALFGLDDESSRTVDVLFRVRDAVISVKDGIAGAWGFVKDFVASIGEIGNILFKGDFTGQGGLFGLDDESSKFVDVLFTVRDTVISVVDSVKNVVQGLWDFLTTVWNGIVTGAQWAFQIIATAVLTPLILAWEAMSWAIKAGWEKIIKPTWDALADGAQWLWNTILMPTFGFIQAGWQALGDGIRWVWESLIKPAWDAVAAGVQWLWDKVLKPTFDLIVAGWNALGDAFRWVYDNFIRPVFDAFVKAAQAVWDGVNVVFGLMLAGWQALGDGLRWVYGTVIQPVWDAFGAGLTWLHDSVVTPVTSWIGEKWQQLGDGMHAVKDWIVDKVFGGLKSGLDTLQGWFQSAVDGIRSIWDGIKKATAAPVKFVVETVYNNGIRKAWNLVSRFTGLNELEEAQLGSLGAYARGGILPGYTPGRDPYLFVEPRTGMSIGLSGGEAIVRPEATRVLGPDWVDGINTAARMGGEKGVARFLGGFADGGVIGSITKVVRENFPMMTITSTFRPGDPGHHGTGNAVDFSNGTDTTPAMQAAAKFFHDNYGPGLFELIHSPTPWNIKNGRNVGDGFGVYGAETMNAHRNHVHVASPNPLGDPSTFVDMADFDGAEGGRFNPLSWVKKTWDKVIDLLPSWDGPGLIGELPGAMLKKLASAAWETVKSAVEKFTSVFTGGGGSAGSAESWRDMAVWAMRREGFNADDPAQVNAMLAQIMSESGGNPGIAQQIVDVNGTGESAGVGLLQIIPGTFEAYRDPSLPNDRRDPEANMVAALRYYKARYGTDLTTMWGQGHGYASGGVLPGYTPGRDVHRFFSPTGGALALSGGEAIMVPEWTRAVGGPAAVAAMNKAARAGRTSGGQGFADGGVFGAAGGVGFGDAVGSLKAAADEIAYAFRGADFGYGELAAVLQNEEWAKAIVDGAAQLGKIADYNSMEGVAARSFASEMSDIAGMLGGKTVSTVTTSLLGAEREIWDAREGYASRAADIAEKEKALEEARKAADKLSSESPELSVKDQRKLADAEEALARARKDAESVTSSNEKSEEARAKAKEKSDQKVSDAEKKLARVREDLGVKEGETAEKRAEDISKANEQVVKAEQELAAARKASAKALDIRIFDVAPQISGMLSQAAAATAAVPAVSNALAGLAAAAGPAGVSVGVAVAAVKTAISTFKEIVGAVDDLVQRARSARIDAWSAMSGMFAAVAEFQGLVRGLREDVTRLAMDQALAQIELAAAYRNVRMVAMDGVRAQLEGVVSVAKAQAEFDASLRADMRAAMAQYDGLSVEFDRFRHNAFTTFDDTMSAQIAWSDRTWALWWELQAAQTGRLILEKQAQADLLEAQYKSTLAVLDLADVTRELEVAAQKLALASSQAFGMDAVGATVGQRWADLQAEKAQLKANNSSAKTWLNPINWFTTMPAATARMKQIDAELRELEARPEFQLDSGTRRSVDAAVRKAGVMGFFGAGDQVDLMMKNTAGDAARALDRMRFESELIDLKSQQDEFRSKIERSQAELDYRRESEPLELMIRALTSEQGAQKTYAEMYRTDNQGVKDALLALAKHQEDTARNIEVMSRQRADDAPAVALYGSSASMDDVQAMLEALGHRVDRVENPPASAALVAASRR